MFEMPPMSTNRSSQSLPPAASFMPSASDFKQSLFKFTQNIIDASLVCTLLHNTTNLVVDWVRVRAVWRPQIKSDEVGVSCCSS